MKAEGFPCSLDLLYGGLGISKLQFLIKKDNFQPPGPGLGTDPDSLEMLDPYPYPDPDSITLVVRLVNTRMDTWTAHKNLTTFTLAFASSLEFSQYCLELAGSHTGFSPSHTNSGPDIRSGICILAPQAPPPPPISNP